MERSKWLLQSAGTSAAQRTAESRSDGRRDEQTNTFDIMGGIDGAQWPYQYQSAWAEFEARAKNDTQSA